jgi:hypothetical protein
VSLTSGPMPDITPPQIGGLLVGGIPIFAELLRAFGVYDLGPQQQEALSNAVTWASVLGGALIGGDAILRVGRNLRRGRVEAASVEAQLVDPSMKPMIPPEKGSTVTGFETPPTVTPQPPPPPTQ